MVNDDTKITPYDTTDVTSEDTKEVLDKIETYLGDDFLSRKFDEDATLDLQENEKETPIKEEEPKSEDKPVVEDKPAEPIVDKPVIDEDKMVESIADRVRDKLVKDLGLSDKEIDDDAPLWEKEDRNPQSYREIANYAAQMIEKKQEAKKIETAESEKKAHELDEEQFGVFEKSINKEWDDQMAELEASNKIPKGEEGKAARLDLFAIMGEIKDKRIAEGKPMITNLKEIYYEHYLPRQNKVKQPAGADAPVGTGKKSVTSGDNQPYSYNELRGKSMYDLISEST